MSAIAGILDLNRNDISTSWIDTIKTVSSCFKTDRTNDYFEQGLYFTCSHQHFTKEAICDRSPITSKDSTVILNADIFLYNRDFLIKKLSDETSTSPSVFSVKGDAELTYELYMKYGIGITDLLNGVYSIVIYDKRIGEIFLITDHVAGRHLAYSIIDNTLYYSTTFHVITALLADRLELDEEWICAAYMSFSPDTEKIPARSVYKGIFRVEPGHYIRIKVPKSETVRPIMMEAENVTYWDPLNSVHPLKLSSDEEYRAVFLNTFINITKNMLRARNKYGILLSSGLDSSAVGSVVARELINENKKLYSYTQIPSKDFIRTSKGFSLEDETPGVLMNKEKYPNIECKFVESMDLTSYSEPEKYIHMFAQPVKPIINAPYIYAMNEKIKEDEISIVFTGSSGNSTISYGNICSYIYQKNHSFHFISSIKEAAAFCKLHGIDRPKFLKYYIKKVNERRKKIEPDNFVKEELKEKYNLRKRLNIYYKNIGGGDVDSYREWKNFIYKPLETQHMSYYTTCQSLFCGAIYLDPTLTKDVIELCISLPIDCFVKNGKDRRAVRDYFKGIVSDDILDNHLFHGAQAGDRLFRAHKYWKDTQGILFENLNTRDLDKYLDRKKIDKLIEDLRNIDGNMDNDTLFSSSVISALGCFLKNYNKYTGVNKWIKPQSLS